ncbi:MAG: hypothetical protein HC771_16745 [Synechococcales cyanobacterium CRU_2_2]|nr:hypothetical protein [Synechococcales cyanobacterium CRU_2_2]
MIAVWLNTIKSGLIAAIFRAAAHCAETIWEWLKKVRAVVDSTIRNIPGFNAIPERIHQQRLAAHRSKLPVLSTQDRCILKALQEDGTYIISLNDLGIELTEQFWQYSVQLAQELKDMPSHGKSCINLGQERLMDYPEIYLWGLNTRLLNIVENYIGLPILYHGCSMRRDIANGETADVIRRWHIDCEDHRVIKLIIYFNDVDLAGGCYNYIPQKLTEKTLPLLRYKSSHISDRAMAQVLPKSNWKECPGSQGTVIMSATGSLFHRACPPVSQDRFSISFCYTSDKPHRHWVFDRVSSQQWKKIDERLDEDKKRYLVNRNKWLSVKM